MRVPNPAISLNPFYFLGAPQTRHPQQRAYRPCPSSPHDGCTTVASKTSHAYHQVNVSVARLSRPHPPSAHRQRPALYLSQNRAVYRSRHGPGDWYRHQRPGADAADQQLKRRHKGESSTLYWATLNTLLFSHLVLSVSLLIIKRILSIIEKYSILSISYLPDCEISWGDGAGAREHPIINASFSFSS